MAYKTPGVYIEEIPKLPSSVAQVETAIPAFIGYTEMAKNKKDGDLDMVPTRITSLLEYETYFGGAADEEKFVVEISDGNILVTGPNKKADRSPFVMYYSMQMYFANGGGPCYITSVGDFSGAFPDFDKLKDGLKQIEKEDEPTLLVFPDSIFLQDIEKFYDLYDLALAQCTKLQDRFTIIDTYDDSSTAIASLRDKIINDPLQLKYGAAYYPFLQTSLSYKYAAKDVVVNNPDGDDYSDDVAYIASSIGTNTDTLTDLLEVFEELNDSISDPTPPTFSALSTSVTNNISATRNQLSVLKDKFGNMVSVGELAYSNADPLDPNYGALNSANESLEDWTTLNIEKAIEGLDDALAELASLDPSTAVLADIEAILSSASATPDSIFKVLGINTPDTIVVKVNKTTSPTGQVTVLKDILKPFSSLPSTAKLDTYELNNNVLYNQIKAEIAKVYVELAPSATVAGIYARVDANRGVWKSPANESLSYVVKPTALVTDEAQGDMNVTPTGKSVNAIRSFTGKGTLIWGARTLTGNSNEWRYISVRRFFNMVEESVKKASEPFVFESNDANTWVKVRSMIENFLTTQWKAGALAGAKTEQAFYVSIGLGETMTSLDVLEGRMIVEIGMAVVRPAEFIILRFSHKMQEA